MLYDRMNKSHGPLFPLHGQDSKDATVQRNGKSYAEITEASLHCILAGLEGHVMVKPSLLWNQNSCKKSVLCDYLKC